MVKSTRFGERRVTASVDSQMMSICSEHGILIPVTKMEEAACVFTALVNPQTHNIWLTLELADKPPALQPGYRVTMLRPGESKDVGLCGKIVQGESTRRMRGGPYGFSAEFRLAVFFAEPKLGDMPNETDIFPIKAMAPKEASETSGLSLAITIFDQ